MDKPKVERIEGMLPAIAIDQVNPVRNSRSTVGTMTELNDHLKLLYARLGTLYCRGCGKPVQRDNAESRSEEHTSELQSLMRISYAVFCLKKRILGKIERAHVQTHVANHHSVISCLRTN